MTDINFTIDGQPVTVPKGTTVYTAAKQMGIEIPIFCYQDRMPPFGACRMCLVEVEKMGKLQTSCTLEATEGMVVKTQSGGAVEGRKEILEFLLINHPLDCPICDRGGECPLQDQTQKFGPGESHFFEEKRHFTKAKPLGPVLMLDRERCIACARCTRFGDIVSGDHALEFIDRGYKTEVGTPDGGPAESKFIGNTIQICPVGALTSNVYRFRARPWDNEPTETTCTLCPVGCSMVLDSRDGEIMRTRTHENRDVNDIWMCDKGWFGYEFTSHLDRLQRPLIRRGANLEPASWEEALSLIAEKMIAAKPNGKLAAIGGNPLTTEENYLLQKLMRDGAGVNNLDHRVGSPIFSIDEEGIGPGMEMSIGDCENLSFAVLFGLDLTEEFPVIWLRLKQAINRGAKVLFIGHYAPEIAPHLAKNVLHAPGMELDKIEELLPEITSLAATGKNGAFFVGRQYLANPKRREILSLLSQFRLNHTNITLNIMEGSGNSLGARLAGMHPDVGPLKPGLNTCQLFETAAQSGWDFLYVVGADPGTHFPAHLWKQVRLNLEFLVVQDLFLTETARHADVVLPTLSYVEKEGTFINIEGRPQPIRPGKMIPEDLYSDGDIFTLLGQKLHTPMSLDQFQIPKLNFSPRNLLPQRGSPNSSVPSVGSVVKNALDLKATFAPALFDRGVRMKHNPHTSKLTKEPHARLHPDEAAKHNVCDGGIIQITANGNTITVKAKLDNKVALGTVVLPLGFEQVPVHDLGVNLLNGLEVEIKS